MQEHTGGENGKACSAAPQSQSWRGMDNVGVWAVSCVKGVWVRAAKEEQ
jgi:hypothetical protein